MKIFLDAGHGGANPGAIGPNGLQEAAVNLDITLRVGRILTGWGYPVAYSRTTDKTVSLAKRAEMANISGAEYFVSIHCNSNENRAAGGASTYYLKDKSISEELAFDVNQSLVEATQLRNLGIISANFAVLRLTRMPAILVETAFISNFTEAELLSQPYFRENCALGIANGIIRYITRY